MKTIIATLLSLPLAAFAQVVCGPYAPFARTLNADGTETVTTSALCQNPDPANWSHTFLLEFPSTITYTNGTTLKFVGNAVAAVSGMDQCASRYSCGERLVLVNSATLTDLSGNLVPIQKYEIGSDPFDQWRSTGTLNPDVVYSFAVSGTDQGVNAAFDTLYLSATYVVVPASGGGD